jgi:hypothetical protein
VDGEEAAWVAEGEEVTSTDRHQKALERRAAVRAAYGSLVDELLVILAAHDLLGIASPQNPNEYEPEVGTILPRLKGASSEMDVELIVKEEFERWFYPRCVKPPRTYHRMSEDIWSAWRIFHSVPDRSPPAQS